ncbi:ABC transporter substrate-binding protein [Pseudoroseomonas cervicalis]|uniref:ABC transporter substrate-binding protein n=1 Tax=Teichococcus cervicalis TaxID=204525 RepID=UPI002788B8F0|nr:ABC transporter substrate-binding protein [Pseudoroseomonas cervicalis]MDQ1078085.1 peptide/nickel transport system substrate-binding protein [Pseudoroseomonas cervicalis]
MTTLLTRRALASGALASGALGGLALAAARPARAAPARLRLGLAASPTTLDPHFHADSANFALHRHLFEALLQWSADGRLLPALARSWAPLPGGGWALRMDPAARFADGRPVTARDAAASLERAMTIPHSPARYTPFLAGLRRAEAVSAELLLLHTDGPAPLLPNGLTTILVVPADTPATPAGAALPGSGPYRLREYRQGEGAWLQRHPGWWQAASRGLPAWAEVALHAMPVDSARLAALLSGELDLIDNVPPRDAAALSRQASLRLARQEGTRVMYLMLGQRPELAPGRPNPLADRRVRQALSLALDRAALARQVMDGAAVPTAQIMPPDRAAAEPALRPPPPDRDAARRLLREAGYAEGFTLPLLGTTDRFTNDEQILQAVAQMWRQLGIQAEVEALPAAAFLPRFAAGRYGAALFGWLTGPGEPNSVFTALLCGRDAARGRGALNGTGYANARLDALVDTALASADSAARQALWRQATRLALAEDVAMLPLFHQASLWASRRGIAYAPRIDSLTLAMDARPEG